MLDAQRVAEYQNQDIKIIFYSKLEKKKNRKYTEQKQKENIKIHIKDRILHHRSIDRKSIIYSNEVNGERNENKIKLIKVIK